MADKDSEKAQAQGKAQAKDAGEDAQAPVQDLPPNHPEDRTETTLTQNEAPDDDAREEAVAKRSGEANR